MKLLWNSNDFVLGIIRKLLLTNYFDLFLIVLGIIRDSYDFLMKSFRNSNEFLGFLRISKEISMNCLAIITIFLGILRKLL